GFIGIAQKAPFDLAELQALRLLDCPNPNRPPNSDVLRPMLNAFDITRRVRRVWNIDFGLNMSLGDAACYELPFRHVKEVVYPLRIEHRELRQAKFWWLFARPCPDMRNAIAGLTRFIVTPRVSKHRVFAWVSPEFLCDSALVVYARSDDYSLGVLHSRLHEVWALKLGTRLETRPRYTPTTCFETFPFPEPTDAQGIGSVRYPRLVPKDAHVFDLAKRTLTRLYNERPTWLDLAHKALDEAVFDAYGWDPSMTDEQILAALLELNLQRSAAGDVASTGAETEEQSEEDDPE